MVDDPDIWRAALLMVKRHGADAALTAARRAEELLLTGDADGAAVWGRILDAVIEVQRITPIKGERVN